MLSEEKYSEQELDIIKNLIVDSIRCLNGVSRFNPLEFTMSFDEKNFKILPLFLSAFIDNIDVYSVGFSGESEKILQVISGKKEVLSEPEYKCHRRLFLHFIDNFCENNCLNQDNFSIENISEYNHVYTYKIIFNGVAYILQGPCIELNIRAEVYRGGEDLRVSANIQEKCGKIENYYIPIVMD